MQKLLEQAQALVASLGEKIRLADEQIANNNKQQIRLDGLKIELDNFQAELLQREADVTPIENIGETLRQANQSKAEADSEWNKIRGEWQKLDEQKAKFAEESRIGREDVKEKKALYDRGAKENKEVKDKLDEKIKKFDEARS